MGYHNSDDSILRRVTWETDLLKLSRVKQCNQIRNHVHGWLMDHQDLHVITVNSGAGYQTLACLETDDLTTEGETEIFDKEGKIRYVFGLKLEIDDAIADGVAVLR